MLRLNEKSIYTLINQYSLNAVVEIHKEKKKNNVATLVISSDPVAHLFFPSFLTVLFTFFLLAC